MRIRSVANLGAYIGAVGANIPTFNFTRCLPGMYDIRHIDVATKCVYTNTIPTAPYRGAGRPEANYVLERVVDEAARVTGIDPVKLRRRNLIKKSAMPYKTAVGTMIDSGDFVPMLDKALELADYENFKRRRRDAQKARQISRARHFLHARTCRRVAGRNRDAGVRRRQAFAQPQRAYTGQGHATVFPGVIAGQVPRHCLREVVHRNGDSSNELPGYASVGSRSAMTAGHSVAKSIEAILQKGKPIAAAMLEAGEADIAYKDGHFAVVGTDRRVSLFAVAARAADMKKRGEDCRGPRYQNDDGNAAVVSQRLPRRRGRDRPRYRTHGDRRLRRGR